MGLRNPKVVSALVSHGFTRKDLDEGWDRFAGLTRKRLSVQVQVPDPQLVESLDSFENTWFPIARLSLERHFPNCAKWIFLNLSQTEGIEVVVSVQTFLERLALMAEAAEPYGAEGPKATELLAQRGLTAQRIQEAQARLDQLGSYRDEPVVELTPEEVQADEDALWSWYLEWGGIARATVKDRRALRSLGFLKSRRSRNVDNNVDTEDGDVSETSEESAQPPAT